MAEITREQIEELRGLLTKATKGPWSTHLVDDTTIISPEREVATTCDSSQTEREDGYNIEYEQMEIDAALIVTMRNALPALLDIAADSLARGSERESAATIRNAALREAAAMCSAYSDWATEKINEGSGDLFGIVGNTADDCAERILALIQPKGGDANAASRIHANATSPGVNHRGERSGD